jgi:Transposase, Mutator family
VGKRQTRWTGFDDKIISLYARGMTTREIQGHLEEMYGIEVSPGLISNVTEAVRTAHLASPPQPYTSAPAPHSTESPSYPVKSCSALMSVSRFQCTAVGERCFRTQTLSASVIES